ncbi:MAG: gamma-glutamyl-gamma-aminobutyrate hydrolase family protein, partial [Candidatus Microthrix sp.]|nr:gamma-glutamyl-gamma-aminobutyrate hydrolase family protein [Candidatus Microthrix sp.]
MLLGLLMCGQVAPAAQGPGGNYPELFASFFAEHDVTLLRVDLDRGEVPDDLDAVDGWITTGSAHSLVSDELPWLPDAIELVRTLVDEDRPYIGDCFGHQLLAVALGGTVERAEV